MSVSLVCLSNLFLFVEAQLGVVPAHEGHVSGQIGQGGRGQRDVLPQGAFGRDQQPCAGTEHAVRRAQRQCK